MADMTSQDMAGKLLAAGFERSGPAATALSDPIADTPMVVTLDQLRPYDHDPRMKRNPAYEEIKASIRERGLDAAPAITRRPGEDHYIIRNGGNTRLAILRELWSETKDERFFRISCLFRPWPERGEIVALTGHLAENELRGGLTFIERALGVEKAREFYEQESSAALSQSELARRLAADGFPVQRSHITRMADAVRYLLPAIPTVLYGGLGRHQVERLSVMRTACKRTWEHYAKDRTLPLDFDSFFQEVLAQFDTQGDEFATQRVQDELIGQMSELLGIGYDVLALDLTESESRHRALVSDPTPPAAPPALPSPTAGTPPPPGVASSIAKPAAAASPPPASPPASEPTLREDTARETTTESPAAAPGDLLLEHIVSPAPTTERLQSIQRMVADQLGDALPPDFSASVLQSIPVQAGGLYPISDVWYIDAGLDTPDRLRIHIAQFAREIAGEAALDECIEDRSDGIGFVCCAARRRLASTAARPGSTPRRLHKALERHGVGQAISAAPPGPASAGPGSRHHGARDVSEGGRMSTSHPLNQAVIAQALYDLRNGQLRRCKAMGFGEAELDALKHPALISVLANASVSWCSVTVNREVLQRLLNQAQDVEKEIATVDRMLRLGASTEMVSRFYGLTHQEVALRREILGLPKRKGRHPVLDETQDTELWRQWKAVTSSRNVDLEDETSILDAAMDLAEGMSLPLSVVWAAIRNWVDQGLD
jgi:ParB family protein of integrating conjugative element (PFGI_1 class)